jgi:hypothetical protein
LEFCAQARLAPRAKAARAAAAFNFIGCLLV